MGYIIYDRRQYRGENLFTGALSGPYRRPPIRNQLPMKERVQRQTEGPNLFRPTRLVRIADMQVIQGSELDSNEYYCTVSYSWGQSGDIVKITDDNGVDDYTCDDKGRHIIIDHPAKKIKATGQPRGRRKHSIAPVSRSVTFPQLLQQIGLDFGVKYIWFDQWCIKQNDPEEKKREIRIMHKIYYNALFTIITIPELQACRRYYQTTDGGVKSLFRLNSDILHYSGYARRSWCLEELNKSQLFVCIGRNAHFWSDTVNINTSQQLTYHHHYLFSICVKSIPWAACTALFHAHKRISTRDHDRIFSLANIFPSTMDHINITYLQPVIDLMLQFYRALALMDIRILLFGVDYANDLIAMDIRKRLAAFLPSWVGMLPTHMLQTMEGDLEPIYPTPKYTINNLKSIQISCRFIQGVLIKHTQNAFLNLRNNSFSQHRNEDQFNIHNYNRRSSMPSKFRMSNKESDVLPFIHSQKRNDVNFKNLSYPGYYGLRPTHRLPLNMVPERLIARNNNDISLPKPLEDGTNAGYLSLTDDDCENIFILSELTYSTNFQELFVMPVVTKKEKHYKSIGICFLHKCINYAHMENEQRFVIE